MAKMPVEKDSMHYNMQHERRGLALIFNHEFFDNPSLNHRRGTNVDANKLKDTLGRYHFEVVELKDYTWKKMLDEIERGNILQQG
jgi:secreted PhoX family phosphatase